mmetsp:Transcript_4872/g.21733  ORF Transcript_4872/g.21733 Transcript_4872/m.21733 type:complete len:345 (+) Transcript_4872:332-1366(+)
MQLLVTLRPLPHEELLALALALALRSLDRELLLARELDDAQVLQALGSLQRLRGFALSLRAFRRVILRLHRLLLTRDEVSLHARHHRVAHRRLLPVLRLRVYPPRGVHSLLGARKLLNLAVHRRLRRSLASLVLLERRVSLGGLHRAAHRLLAPPQLPQALLLLLLGGAPSDKLAVATILAHLREDLLLELFDLEELRVPLLHRGLFPFARLGRLRVVGNLPRLLLLFDERGFVPVADLLDAFLEVDLEVPLLQDVGEQERGVEGFDPVGLVVDHFVRAHDLRLPLRRADGSLLAVQDALGLLLLLEPLRLGRLSLLSLRLEGVVPGALASLAEFFKHILLGVG